MRGASKQISGLVDATANRLMALQVELADADEEERKKHFSAVIGGALDGVVPEEKRAFLRELETRFPAWEMPAAATPDRPPDLTSADFTALLDEVARRMPGLSAADKALAARHLGPPATGPATTGPATPVDGAAFDDLRKRLGVTGDVDPARVSQIAVLLLEFAAGLEIVWEMWKQMAPDSRYQKRGEILKTAARFVARPPGADREQVKANLDPLRKQIVAIGSSVALAGRDIGEQLKEISPATVQKVARAKKPFECPERPWWEKYTEIAWDQRKIEDRVNSSIKVNTEKLLDTLR